MNEVNDDDGNDGDSGGDHDGDDNDDDDDIYYDEVSVCVSRKMITFPSRAERQRREARRPLGLAGRRPALA